MSKEEKSIAETTSNPYEWMKDVAETLKKTRLIAAEQLRKGEGYSGYAASDFDTTPIKLVFGRTPDGGSMYLGTMAAYADVKRWMDAKARQDVFKLLDIKEVYTETLTFETY